MKSLKSFFVFKYWALTLLFILCLFGMWLEIYNQRFELNDLRVYYRTAERLLDGQNLYRIESDSFYIFKYSPVAGLFFIPLTIFSFTQAKVIYWISLSGLYVFSLKYILELSSGRKFEQINRVNGMAFALGASVFIHIFREAHLGQVNFILCLTYILSLGFFQKGKTHLAAFLLAASLFFKPFGLIILFYLIYRKHFTQVFKTTVYMIILALIPFIFYNSLESTLLQYKMWIVEMIIELSNKKDLMQDGNHTIFSVLFRHLHLGAMLKSATAQFIYVLSVLILLGLLSLRIFRKSDSFISKPIIVDFAYLIALIPLLSYTSRNAFIFSMLLIGVLLIHFRKMMYWQKALFVAAVFFIGGNNIEILGPDLTYFLEDISIVSIGTMILISLLVMFQPSNDAAARKT